MEKDGIYGCGVVRRDRKGLPPGLKKHGLKKRYYCACVCMCMLLRVCVCFCECVCVCVWCVVCVTVLTKIIYLTFDRGESKIFQKGPLVACAWHDSKVLTVLSTTSQPVAMGSVVRRQRDGGVDRGDQIRGYYSCRTRSRKFYKYIIFYFLFDVSITNAFILHTNYTSKPNRNVKDFRLQLAKELIGT